MPKNKTDSNNTVRTYITLDYLNPWDPATWSSNPSWLYSTLKKEGKIRFSLWIQNYRLLSGMAYAMSSLLLMRHNKRDCRIYAQRKIRRRLLGARANALLKKLPKDDEKNLCLLTFSNALIDFSRCPLPVWHYSDSTLAAAARLDANTKNISDKIMTELLAEETASYQRLDRLLLFSEWAARSAREDHKLDAAKVSIIGHGPCIPDPGAFTKIRAGNPRILFVCTDWHRKGGDLIMEAFAKVRQKRPSVELVVIGRFDPSIQIGGHNIIWIAPLRKSEPSELRELVSWYQSADVLVLASSYDPMPNVTLEANLCGTPVVATNVCAISEQIHDGINGWLVSRSSDAVCDSIIRVLDAGPGLRESSRCYITQNHSWELVTKRLSLI